MSELPDYFFRVRENGAIVFAVDSENRNRRVEMMQIAVINIRNGEVKPHGDRVLAAQDIAAIEEWMTGRRAVLAAREMDDIRRTVDHLNQMAQWVQSRATEDQLGEVTDDLLLSMHDLRAVLVRKRAEKLMRGAPS